MAETDKSPAAAPAPAGPTSPADSAEPTSWSPQRSRRTVVIYFLVLITGLCALLYAWDLPPFASGNQTTTNAYVRGQTTVISPQVGGYVTQVLASDFDDVKAGQILVRIDESNYRAKVEQGIATVAAQTAGLANSEQDERSSEAQLRLQDAAIAAAQAQLVKASADLRRINDLVDGGSVSERERDQAAAALRQAQAGVRQAEAQRASAAENVKSVTVGRGALRAGVEGANASRELASIDLQRTIIRAPVTGKLSEVAVRVGQLVSPGTQLMYLVPRKHWVIANFKEAQTADIRVGQRATVEIDALGGETLAGVVESISPAAGSEFSLIKPDTGSGNFVKVPQRIAVRIRLDPKQKLYDRIGPGMSVIATVHTDED